MAYDASQALTVIDGGLTLADGAGRALVGDDGQELAIVDGC